MIAEIGQPDRFQGIPGPLIAQALLHALEFHGDLDVIDDGVPGKQRAFLEDEGDIIGQGLGDLNLTRLDLALGRIDQPTHDIQERALAAAARANQAEKFTLGNFDGYVIQGDDASGIVVIAKHMGDAIGPDGRAIG